MTDNHTRLGQRLYCKESFNEKWQKREVVLGKERADGPYYLTITPVTGLPKVLHVPRSKLVVLGSNFAVLHMGEVEGRKNVLWLMPVDGTGSQMLLSCECADKFVKVKQQVQEYCRGWSFHVTIERDQELPAGSAVLHVFKDKFHLLSNNEGSPVATLGQWHFRSVEQIRQVKDGVMLNIGGLTEPHWIILRTTEGETIFRLLERNIEYIAMPVRHEESSECDINQNEELGSLPEEPGKEGVSNGALTCNGKPDVWVPRLPAKPKPVENDNASHSLRTDGSPCPSDSSLASPDNKEEHPSDGLKMPEPYQNGTSDLRLDLPEAECATIKHPPKCYMYVNQNSLIRESQEGRSIKHCYENLNYLGDQCTPPPLQPRQKAPEIPPRGMSRKMNNYDVPPKLPPKLYSKPAIPQVKVLVGVFASTCVLGNYWFLRVAVMCKDPDDVTMKRVIEHEQNSKHHFLKSQPLLVESNIKIALNTKSEGFHCEDSDRFQCVDFEDVKNLRRGDWFVVEFHLRSSTHTEFFGKVYVGPLCGSSGFDQCGANRKVDIGVNETFKANIPDGQEETSQPVQPVQVSPLTSPCPSPPSQPRKSPPDVLENYEKRLIICNGLDLTCTENNWKIVAAKLGLSASKISQLQDRACRSVHYSPMEVVLKLWQERDPCSYSWDKLKNILQDIQRLDIIQDVEGSGK